MSSAKNAFMVYLILILATFLTSIVSGVLSMAGGTILMGVFGFLLSVPAAMVLHGTAQAFSNGARVWLYRRYIRWRVLGFYTLGALMVLGAFTVFTFVPDIGLIFILIGSFPFLARIMPGSINLDMEKPAISLSSGLLVTTAQMLAGASGPVLDLFYVNSSMTREEILGTKAVTQTLGHLLKLVYYTFIMIVAAGSLPVWVYPAVIVAAITGNYLASFIVARISDSQFRHAGSIVIMMIGMIFIVKGTAELFG
jgi:uncharacterized membrane protein YfcA